MNFIIFNLLVITAWLTLVLWCGGAWLTWRGIRRQRELGVIENPTLKDAVAPLVSILVPARNEANRTLENSIASMLAQDYENYEVIVTNDRSIDATGEILHRLARRDARLKIIDGKDLPAGWLGKPHAMNQAFEVARGSWILATDADMLFDGRALSTTLFHAQTNGYDALTLLPRVECVTFWERVFMPTFGWFMLLARPLERVNDGTKADALGVGGFFLIRRAWVERIGGWRAVRAEVAEDLRLAEKLKAAGARLRIEYAPRLVRTQMQTDLAEIWEGFTKNLYAGTRFSLARAVFGGAAVFVFSVLPSIVAVVCFVTWMFSNSSARWMMMLGVPLALVWAVQALTFGFVYKQIGLPLRFAWLVPLGHLLFVMILFNSAFRIAFGSGVMWKGRVLYRRDGVRPPRDV
ncbi:MAG: glycosyltransferase [Pyrinomonadaceae bacterium MAG19_C2-C3]|nr:glycosyltransferase [Pyrinomonadaceae bacterium MAG19_C2-C3]